MMIKKVYAKKEWLHLIQTTNNHLIFITLVNFQINERCNSIRKD